MAIPAPNWLKSANLETTSTTAMVSGPYVLQEWVKGSHLLFKANEAHLTFHIALDDAKSEGVRVRVSRSRSR